MKKDINAFKGFSNESFLFLKELAKNNNTSWFANNKNRYDEFIVQPAKSFVTDIAPYFNNLNSSIRTEPKFNKTLMRINKDMRFAKGNPYKTYFLIHFGRFKMDSEFYVYLDGESVQYGLFINNSGEEHFYFGRNFDKYKKEMKKTFKEFDINNHFNLYEFKKEQNEVKINFNFDKDADVLSKMKFILFQKEITPGEMINASEEFIIETIKTFSKLYPVYCYSITHEPLKLIEDYRERFGTSFI